MKLAKPTDRAALEHWCHAPGCKRWGAYGYPGGRWYCAAHRPPESPFSPEPVRVEPEQKDLFDGRAK